MQQIKKKNLKKNLNIISDKYLKSGCKKFFSNFLETQNFKVHRKRIILC